MNLADTTNGNASRDLDHSYANADNEVYHDVPSHGTDGDFDADAGYNPTTNRVLSSEDAARTPIYAQHAARSQWAQEGADAARPGTGGAEHPVPDASTHEWAQSSYDRGDVSSASAAAAAAMAATAGADLNAVPGHGDPNQPDGGFLMQKQPVARRLGRCRFGSGSALRLQPEQRCGLLECSGGNHQSNLADVTASTVGHQSDAYDGYTGGATTTSQTHHEPASNPTGMLGAPTCRPSAPLRHSPARPTHRRRP